MNYIVLAAIAVLVVIFIYGVIQSGEAIKKPTLDNKGKPTPYINNSSNWDHFEKPYARVLSNEELSVQVCDKLSPDAPPVRTLYKESLYRNTGDCLSLVRFYGFLVIIDVKSEEVIVKDNFHRIVLEKSEDDENVYQTTNIAILTFINLYY
jgi:hypothetical protein